MAEVSAEERAKQIVQLYRPGSCLFKGSSEDIVRSYIKMEKETWLLMMKHDYTLALIRRDSETSEKLRKAYDAVADMFGWSEDILKAVEEEIAKNPRQAARGAVEALFKMYCKEVQEKTFPAGVGLPLGAWRERPDETIEEGFNKYPGRMDVKGYLYCEERLLWSCVDDELLKTAKEVKFDRVAHWFAIELRDRVIVYICGPPPECDELKGLPEEPGNPYLRNAIEDSLAGKEVSYWEAMEQWGLECADFYLKHYKNEWGIQSAARSVVCALMAKARIDPDPQLAEDFLRQLTEKMKIPSLFKLYEEAVHGPPGYREKLPNRFSPDYSEKVKVMEEEMLKKCRVFVGAMRHIFFTKPEDRKFTLVVDGIEF